jgi:hypothetical protein
MIVIIDVNILGPLVQEEMDAGDKYFEDLFFSLQSGDWFILANWFFFYFLINALDDYFDPVFKGQTVNQFCSNSKTNSMDPYIFAFIIGAWFDKCNPYHRSLSILT